MDFVKKIIYFILSLQEVGLRESLRDTLHAKPKSKRKFYYRSGCLLTLDSIAENEKKRMEEELKLILKTYDYEPSKILEYISKQGTKIFYIDSANVLNSVGENEGFIYPQKGGKALYLSLLTEKKFSLKFPECFIMTNKSENINKYYFIYHFYNWYAFKHGISGLDGETVDTLNKYLYNASDDEIKKLQLAEIYKLKDAIKQDKSSIEFVFKLCRQYEASKSALEKMKNSGANL
ncbi:MAG: hypothetical protein MJ237_03390 [bacterium]|nr:hypothetical protein [bacterium]